ncbi:uncharacterized protein CELE_K02E10.4 [Caenorhabditis elegans]|uniref:Uncharacterized protein n=1 Tax=Caenorhabditis elegans TaxID=6239 RepID=H2L0B3_CAEEL|nr:Uncharacterized protein CELE_K02E10.4 [Caenorhabditis elegans]CCD72277.1 Uncharacterized protein CELE_K02E10.4 [Caenorhabditis elegans]|eukprot:NP_001024750.1 Uncharacterized protein CELE_K02E10.4 [Caenorhabditis elegans]
MQICDNFYLSSLVIPPEKGDASVKEVNRLHVLNPSFLFLSIFPLHFPDRVPLPSTTPYYHSNPSTTFFMIPTTTFVSCYFLILLVYFASAQAPTCPNGQLPKLDSSLRPLQCLPGTSQHLICGANHNCFFTGLNYMCCPSNEPSIDNQPSCPYPKLTVLDPHGLPMKCSQIARSCPGENMHCADVGLGYICCEDPSFQRKHAPPPTTTKSPRGYRVKATTPLPEEELECPKQSIGLLSSNGSRVICNSRNPCPGTDTFCFGEYKRSICCQKYLYASDILDDPATTTTQQPKRGFQSISMSMRQPLPGKIHDGQYLKPTTTSSSTTTTTTTTAPPPIVDQEFPQIAINSVGVRRKGPIRPAQRVKPSEVGGNAMVTRTWIPRQSFTFPTVPTTTQTPTTRPVPSAVARRNRLNGVQSFTGSTEFKPSTLNLEKNQQNDPNRHALAQKLLSYQIRNGWPYDERFYRPDVDVYTEEQKSEIARMRFLPQ